jgi:integrase
MVRQLNKLSSKFIENTTEPGRYSDGGGLYLQVAAGRKGVTKSWLFRYMRGGGTSRAMGLGAFSTNKRDGLVTTKEARDRAFMARESLKAGIDPLEAKQALKTAARIEAARAVTFAQCTDEYIEGHKAGWKGAKHARDWRGTLAKYVLPEFGSFPVAAIDTALVLKVLKPIWQTKTKTAVDVRSRIELILNWAKIHGYRDGENPARWKGHLDNALPLPSKVTKVKHHAAVPYAEVPAFMVALREKTVLGARALEWTVLAATRSEETLGAEWSEIDIEKKVWTIKASRMKADADHRVPLTGRMLEILKSLPREGKHVFPGQAPSKRASGAVMWFLLRGMTSSGETVHGFRSSFRDWAAEQTAYPSDVIEMALAHTITNKVEAAYRRGDLFEKRRRLMADWSDYCTSKPADRSETVVNLRRTGTEA